MELDKGKNYMVIECKGTFNSKELDDFRKDGWELIGVVYCCNITHYFKKLKKDVKKVKNES